MLPHRSTVLCSTLLLALLAVAVTPALTGCDGSRHVNDTDVYLLPIEEFDALRQKHGETLRLIDVRGTDTFNRGHLPGAVSVPLPALRAAHPDLAGGSAFVVYASGPMDPLSLAAAKKLIGLKYAPVYDLRGGVELWQAAGRSLESKE